jgi:perosamine synthetase
MAQVESGLVRNARAMIPLSKVQLTEEEVAAAVQVLRSGALRQGPVTAALEEAFAAQVGAKFAVAVSSGTAALHLLYRDYLRPGDEILVPTFTFIATASMASLAGARPVFCDVDGRTFTLNAADARGRLTLKTRALAPVHLFGNPCDVAAIFGLAREFNLTVIWDAAQAHGARYQGRDIGALDAAVAYSFYPTKNLFLGEGGMITTNDAGLYQRLKLTRSHGEAGRYLHTCLGFNYRLTDVEAAIGLKQLERLPELVERRRANAAYLTEHLGEMPQIQTPVEQTEGTHSFNQYCVVLDLEALRCSRDEFAAYLGELGVGTGVHYPRGLHQQPVFQEAYGPLTLPVAESLAKTILALPVHPWLTSGELERIVAAVRRAGEKFAR